MIPNFLNFYKYFIKIKFRAYKTIKRKPYSEYGMDGGG